MTRAERAAWLAEVKARADAASPGPWYWAEHVNSVLAQDPDHGDAPDYTIADLEKRYRAAPNSRFIAAARTDVPALLAEIARLEKDREDFAKAIVEMEWTATRDEPFAHCLWCDAYYLDGQHAADCIVLRARAALDKPLPPAPEA